MGLKVAALFDGMSCGLISFKELGINVDEYIAWEIDPYAIKTSRYNFPEIKHMGDVFEADFSKYKGFDFLIGGSPCTYWSVAQKKGRETEASGLGWELFQQYIRALKEIQPKFFIYENNKSMSMAIRDSIRSEFGFNEVCIDSALVSAQRRQRYYWIGKRTKAGIYEQVHINMPKDRGVVVRDILDDCYPGNVGVNPIPLNITKDGKSQTLKAQYINTSPKNICCYHSTYGATGVAEVVPVPTSPDKVFCLPSPDGTIRDSQAFRVYSINGKSVTQSACGGGSGGKTGLYAIPTTMISRADRKEYPVLSAKGGLITIRGGRYPTRLPDGYYIIRKLTVSECMRLQTVPEWYRFPVSMTRAYKLLGNGWTCSIIMILIQACMQELEVT